MPRNIAAAVVNPAGRPLTAEPPAPPHLDPNRPPRELPRGPVKLPGRSSPSLPRRSATAAARHRRRPCCSAADPSPGCPRPQEDHLRVALDLLYPFPHFPSPPVSSLARKRRRRHLLCSWLWPGAYLRAPKSFQGLRCKISFSFLFVFKNSELVNSFTNRRKIIKIQTQLFWNLCKEIYNFCYMNFFICSIVFALFKIQRIGSFYCISSSMHVLVAIFSQ